MVSKKWQGKYNKNINDKCKIMYNIINIIDVKVISMKGNGKE